jgi:hypothetical protein
MTAFALAEVAKIITVKTGAIAQEVAVGTKAAATGEAGGMLSCA